MSQSKTPRMPYTHTRQDALKAGVLIDATDAAKAAGFSHPLAFTATAWARCVVVPIDCPDEEEENRLHQVFFSLFHAVRSAPEDSLVRFPVPVRNHPHRNECIDCMAYSGPGDDGQPVITIMLAHEG